MKRGGFLYALVALLGFQPPAESLGGDLLYHLDSKEHPMTRKQIRRENARRAGTRPTYPSTKSVVIASPTRALPNRLVVRPVDRRDPHSYPLGGNERIAWFPPSMRPVNPGRARRSPLVTGSYPAVTMKPAERRKLRAERHAVVSGGGLWWRLHAEKLAAAREPARLAEVARVRLAKIRARVRRDLIIASTLSGRAAA